MATHELQFLDTLESVIVERLKNPSTDSYTSSLAALGSKRIAQKVGEEAVELALASIDGNRDEIVDEAADLVYHLLVMLSVRNISLREIASALEARHTG